jgi:hypothetical protein
MFSIFFIIFTKLRHSYEVTYKINYLKYENRVSKFSKQHLSWHLRVSNFLNIFGIFYNSNEVMCSYWKQFQDELSLIRLEQLCKKYI